MGTRNPLRAPIGILEVMTPHWKVFTHDFGLREA